MDYDGFLFSRRCKTGTIDTLPRADRKACMRRHGLLSTHSYLAMMIPTARSAPSLLGWC